MNVTNQKQHEKCTILTKNHIKKKNTPEQKQDRKWVLLSVKACFWILHRFPEPGSKQFFPFLCRLCNQRYILVWYCLETGYILKVIVKIEHKFNQRRHLFVQFRLFVIFYINLRSPRIVAPKSSSSAVLYSLSFSAISPSFSVWQISMSG